MTDLIYVASVKDGVVRFSDRKGFDDDMKAFEGFRIMIKVRKYRKSRSLDQNAYYHGCVVNAVKDGLVDMGFDRHLLSHENVHDMLREKFLKEDIAIADGEHAGEFVTFVRSTTDLSTVEFMDYIADIQKWSSEFLNIVIPDPEKQSKLPLNK